MTPSPAILDFIKGWESCKLIPYLDQAKHWTVGWGHLLPLTDMRGEISQDQADILLAQDIDATNRGLLMLISSSPSQQQWDALLSLGFNEGVREISNSSLLRHINEGDWGAASYQFPMWHYEHVNGQLISSNGLYKRRLAEQAIFERGDYSGRP